MNISDLEFERAARSLPVELVLNPPILPKGLYQS
jgi:hypothetical protein